MKPASIMAVEKDGYIAVIPINITRGLTDKLVEKRKGAALELERQVCRYSIMMNYTNLYILLYIYIYIYI